MLKPGDTAPSFELEADSGETVRLEQFRGKRVILYFYPKDDTPGCTTEACDFRDRMEAVEELGAVVLGVSPDSVASHQKFKARYELPFRLLADPDHRVAEAYGAWGEKKRYGRTYEGILRSTFVIGEDGRVERVFQNVKAKGHADQVVNSMK